MLALHDKLRIGLSPTAAWEFCTGWTADPWQEELVTAILEGEDWLVIETLHRGPAGSQLSVFTEGAHVISENMENLTIASAPRLLRELAEEIANEKSDLREGLRQQTREKKQRQEERRAECAMSFEHFGLELPDDFDPTKVPLRRSGEAVFQEAVLAWAVEHIERGLRDGEFGVGVNSIIVGVEELKSFEQITVNKQCDYQVTEERDLFCTADTSSDPALGPMRIVGLKSFSPTSHH